MGRTTYDDVQIGATFTSEGRVMTTGFKRILIPTDLSDFSGLALKYGALFNRRAGSNLTLLFVEEGYVAFDLSAMPAGYYINNFPGSPDPLMERLSEQSRLYAPGISVQK